MLLRLGTALIVGEHAERYQCSTCREAQQRALGCSRRGYPMPRVPPISLGLPDGTQRSFLDCPVNVLPQRLLRFLRAYPAHEAGRPWYPGATGQLPARYLAAMAIVADEARRIRQAEAEARRAAAGAPDARRRHAPLRRRA